MAEQADDLVQAIIDKNRLAAKKAQEKSTTFGAAIAFGAFEIVTALGIVHFPQSDGINLYRMATAGACVGLGAVIGRWVGRPPNRK